MEETPAGISAPVAESSPASVEPSSSRRRATGQKRKANVLSTTTSSSTPSSSKRLTREKAAAAAAAAVISHTPIHNGPLTRARQSPNNFAPLASAASFVKLEEKAALAAPDVAMVVAEENRSKLEELESAMEAEFEVIRSRDAKTHVVPSHCGWFSWTKIHPLEERALPSFFNGKSQIRTRDNYMEIRNWIMKKFHGNPNTQIELKDLSELEVADLDSRQVVLEFLDFWGLINFHPLAQMVSAVIADGDGAAKKDSLLEKLFRFEAFQPYPPVVSKPNVTTPALPSGLFPESAIAEDLVRPEGPNVEYHCNSCSADCSRKRYHCQKQADYDLCADCFSSGKFGSNMNLGDFILMEPAEAPGISGGKWTDQETLLLLEALELYKENWNEIAEHVATKTKAQCILHFVQMPIEDAFFDCDDDIDSISKATADPAAAIDDESAPKDVSGTSECKTDTKEDQPLTSHTNVSKPEDASEVKFGQETAKPDTSEVMVGQESSKSEDTCEVKVGKQTNENVALKALREAFEAVGYLPTPENRLSFAEVGNPVMALAAFLARFVEPDVAVATARSSLKSLSRNSPGMQLAARHCFVLEHPPDKMKEQSGFDCVAAEMACQEAQKDNQDQKGISSTSTSDDNDLSNNHSNKKSEHSVPEEKKPIDSSNGNSLEKVNAENQAATADTHGEVECGKLNESSNLPKEKPPGAVKESDEMPSKSECPPCSVKELQEGSVVEEHSQLVEAPKDVNLVSDLMSSEKNEPSQSVTSLSVEEPAQTAEASKDVDMVSDSQPSDNNEPKQLVQSNSVGECFQLTEAPKDVDMLSSLPSEVNESQQRVTPNSVVENGATSVEDPKDSMKEKPHCQVIEDDNNIDKLKCAAISALSAAAVKAKLLANQEEHQIRQLAASLIEKLLHKLETKLSFFTEMDSVIMRVREQLDRSRQKLYHERAQIIAARLGRPPSSSRAMPPSILVNRMAMNFANSVPRPPMSMASVRPPISRSMGTSVAATPSNPFVPTTTSGSSIRPSGQDKLSSVGTK